MKRQKPKTKSISEIQKLTSKIIEFRDARDWKQFHNPKDMSLSLVLESCELMEHFQWKSCEEMEAYIKTQKNELAEELVDILYWVLLMSHDWNIDLVESFDKKIKKNENKYPVKKAWGKHTKYNKL